MNSPSCPVHIDTYRFGEIIVDGHSYKKDLIVFPDHVAPQWWREKGHSLSLPDLEEIFIDSPDLLIIGSGAYGRMKVPVHTQEQIRAKGLIIQILKTKEACQTYNDLCDTQRVAAALHLTC